MLNRHEALRALLAVGLRATPATAGTVTAADGSVLRWSKTRRRPTPTDVRRELDQLQVDERLIIAVETASPSLVAAASADARIILIDDGARTVWLNQRPLPTDDAVPPPTAPTTKGPVPYGQYAVLRALLITGSPMLQTMVAAATGLAQSSVSDALRALGDLVERTAAGWQVTDARAAWDRALLVPDNGLTTYWWSDRPLAEQAAVLPAEALISGDLAADRIAGWRIPEHVTAYLRTGIDLSRQPFALGDAGNYTLSITIPADDTIWATAAHAGRPGTADPIITARDILRTGTTGDHQEAAGRIRDSTLHADVGTQHK